MQEEVENRTLTLVVSGTKFTGRMFKAAISKYMAHRKEKKLEKQRSRDAPVVPHGKQTVKQLVGQNQGISNIEITDPSIKEFEKIARKYGVDYAVKKDRSSSPPKYLIFFKGRDADALTAAFTEYTNKKVKKATKTCMEDEMGVSDKITSIVIPLGATVNMDAVSIVLSFMIVFFANACGVEVSTSMMNVILLANVILSVGTPGIPGGAIALFAALATMAGLPAGVMGVYISINTLCDMGATCVNVIGDMAGCVVLKEKIKLDD